MSHARILVLESTHRIVIQSRQATLQLQGLASPSIPHQSITACLIHVLLLSVCDSRPSRHAFSGATCECAADLFRHHRSAAVRADILVR
jgi:hypothetical protein